MKTYKATLTQNVPESVISKKNLSTCYGYTVWKKDVVVAIKEGEKEVEYFIRLEEEGVCDKVQQVIEEVEDDKRLLEFMEDNDLDVIFTDMENGDGK